MELWEASGLLGMAEAWAESSSMGEDAGETRCSAVPERWWDAGEHLTLQEKPEKSSCGEQQVHLEREEPQQDEGWQPQQQSPPDSPNQTPPLKAVASTRVTWRTGGIWQCWRHFFFFFLAALAGSWVPLASNR